MSQLSLDAWEQDLKRDNQGVIDLLRENEATDLAYRLETMQETIEFLQERCATYQKGWNDTAMELRQRVIDKSQEQGIIAALKTENATLRNKLYPKGEGDSLAIMDAGRKLVD